MKRIALIAFALILTSCSTHHTMSLAKLTAPKYGGLPCDTIYTYCQVYQRPITDLPVHKWSSSWRASLNTGSNSHTTLWRNFSTGGTGFALRQGNFTTGAQSPALANWKHFTSFGDAGLSNDIAYPYDAPYPAQDSTPPANSRLEQYDSLTIHPDAHYLVIDEGTNASYEAYAFLWSGTAASCYIAQQFDLSSTNYNLPPAGSTADESGQCIAKLVLRPSEVNYAIAHSLPDLGHAIRINIRGGAAASYYLWPARHSHGGGGTDSTFVPFGARVRLKSTYDISGFTPQAKVILATLQKFGAVVSDIGESWSLTGCAYEEIDGAKNPYTWVPGSLSEIRTVPSSQLEFVDESSIELASNSSKCVLSAVCQ